MRLIDAAPAAAMLAVSVGVLVGTRDLPYWAEFAPGPAFAPYWVAGAGTLISILLLVQAVRAGAGGRVEWPDRAGRLRVLLTVVSLGVSVFLGPHLGIVTTSVLFSVIMLVGILGRAWLPSCATALVTGALIYGVFLRWLGVALPTGPLGF
jgi:hypothetical protein